MKDEIPDLDVSLSTGNLDQATAWLRNVQIHGSLFEPRATIEKATGRSNGKTTFKLS